MTLYQIFLARSSRMSPADRHQAFLLLEHLADIDPASGSRDAPPANFYGRSIREMVADQPDGFAAE